MFHFCMDKHDFKLKLIMDIFIKPMDFAKFHKKGCIRMRILRFPQYFVVIINTYTTFIVCDINGWSVINCHIKYRLTDGRKSLFCFRSKQLYLIHLRPFYVNRQTMLCV